MILKLQHNWQYDHRTFNFDRSTNQLISTLSAWVESEKDKTPWDVLPNRQLLLLLDCAVHASEVCLGEPRFLQFETSNIRSW